MIASDYAELNGRQRLVSELPPNSKYKVTVICPTCNQSRKVIYMSLVKAGHYKCISCANKEKNTQRTPIGTVSGRLTVVGKSERRRHVVCRCICGNIGDYYKPNIESGHTKSCGCLKKESFNGVKRPQKEEHGNWKGGISGERYSYMQSAEYKKWRSSVFERDNYTCQKCGQVGYKLNAHHIKSYSGNEDKRTDTDNGITLCKDCHIQFHNEYGRKNIDRGSIEDFVKIGGAHNATT